MSVKRHSTEAVAGWSLEEELARGGGTLDPDGPVIDGNVALARQVLEAAGHNPAHAPLLLDGARGIPGGDVSPVATTDRELAAQIVRHGEGMARALARNDARLMRYHALRYARALHAIAQLDNPGTGRPPKVTRALIDEVERSQDWPKVELMVEEIARRAKVDPSNVWKALAARKRA